MNNLKAEEAAYILGIAEEGIFGKFKDKIKSKFIKPSKNTTTEPVVQSHHSQPIRDNQNEISLDEFNKRYRPQFEYACKELSKLFAKLKKDRRAVNAIKWYDFTISNRYDDITGITLNIAGYDFMDNSGIRRDLYDDPEWKASKDYIYAKIMNFDFGSKCPDLTIDVDGEYDSGTFYLELKDIYCDELVYCEE